jgi:multisubunit Na+/H+ antiporter MnhG subunit
MFDELPQSYRKRMKIIAFIVLPILIIAATIFFVTIANYLNVLGELKYILFIFLSQIFIYFACCQGAYKNLKKESEMDTINRIKKT